MQKFRIFSFFFIFVSVFLFLLFQSGSIAQVDIYDYTEYSEKINISSLDLQEVTYSGSSTLLESKTHFTTPRTTFSFSFPGYRTKNPDDLQVEWIVDGRIFHRSLDTDGPNGSDQEPMTFPFVTSARTDIAFRIISRSGVVPSVAVLSSSNQSSIGKKITFSPHLSQAIASDGTPKIVSRAEWGADETLRYISASRIEKSIADWEARDKKPKIIEETEGARAKRLQDDREFQDIASLDTDANTVVTLTRYEGNHKLLWPIRTAKKINRIVVHHTAESLDQDADDATLMRAIYYYHTVKRGWGDIGYNFVVGQRGVIYEGRAGGDYAEGAHAYANNLGTVGVSVIGNYDTYHLNRDQEAGLINMLVYLSKKYGINVRESVSGINRCGKEESCFWKKNTVLGLSGHRDLATTHCPGENLYAALENISITVAGKVGNVSPVYNQLQTKKDSLDEYDQSVYVLKSVAPSVTSSRTETVSTKKIASLIPPRLAIIPPLPGDTPYNIARLATPSPSLGGKKIKIRLSYPASTLVLASATEKGATARLDGKTIPFFRENQAQINLTPDSKLSIKIGKKTFVGYTFSLSSDLVSIPSWNHRPTWDTSGKYNDNVYRGTVTLRNEGNTLLVINELPIDDYLRGLGEVSDADLPEKIKTITVAARSYATYYTDQKNRKYNTKLYDGSDNPDEFQRYLGYGYELRSPNVSRIVSETRGTVIRYAGKIIKAFYFSSSDGRTRSYKEYCQMNNPGKVCEDVPYLQSVDDPAGVGKVRTGHGVGISGIGATYGASLGKKYTEIIQYYMSGVTVGK